MRIWSAERCASDIMPKELRELMRHKDISTTMKYYVGRITEKTADTPWGAYENRKSALKDNTFGTTTDFAPDESHEHFVPSRYEKACSE